MSRDENAECLRNRDEVETSLKIFRQDIENFSLTCDVGETGIDVHVESLLNLIGCAAAEIYNQIESLVEDELWNDVLYGLENRYAFKQNSIVWQSKFFMRVQRESEPFDQFYTGLKEIMANCHFGDATENLLKTQIALGVNDENTRQRLLDRDMDLDYMIIYCRAVELFEKKSRVRFSTKSFDPSSHNVSNGEVANHDGDTFSLLMKNSVPSNLSLCESNHNELKGHQLDFSTPSRPVVRKLRRQNCVMETRSVEWDKRLPSIEELQSSNGTDNSVSSRIASFERSTGENNRNNNNSNCGEKTSYLKAITKLRRRSMISMTANRSFENNNYESYLKSKMNKDLHVMYQDYRLLNDILDVTMCRACDDNSKTIALGEENSLFTIDPAKPWLLLRNKIVKWLKSHDREDLIKRNRTSRDDLTTEGGSIDGGGQSIAADDDQQCATEIKSKSQMIVEELVSTEQAFIDVLTLLCGQFVTSVKALGDEAKIPPVSLSKIFSPLPQLLKLSEMMSKEMQSRSENWHNDPRIADIIVNKGPFLKLYSTYIQNFASQTVLLGECCKKYPRFGQCVKDFEALDVCKKLTIKHYMLAPIQRMPRYKLLLNRYLKSLDETSIDYKNAILALDIISDVCNQVDKSVENGDCVIKLVQIQSKLKKDVIIKPGRELIKEGELYKLSRKHTRLRYFILMNDVFFYMSHQNKITGLRIKTKLSLKGMKVLTKNENEFDVITSTRSFSLRAQTPVLCNEWVIALEASISKYNKRQLVLRTSRFSPVYRSFEQLQFGNTAPVWIQDNSVSQCLCCAVEFTFWFRRHHCRACGKVVCAKCSENKAPLYYKNFHSVRVCDECFLLSLVEFTKTMPSISQKAYEYSDFESIKILENIKKSFKSKHNKTLPNVLQMPFELKPKDNGSIISGWLHQRSSRKTWKTFWFVLNQQQTLSVFKAPQDISPIFVIDVYLYKVERFMEDTYFEDYDSSCVFQLASNALSGMVPLVFRADSKEIAYKWVYALNEAADLTA